MYEYYHDKDTSFDISTTDILSGAGSHTPSMFSMQA